LGGVFGCGKKLEGKLGGGFPELISGIAFDGKAVHATSKKPRGTIFERANAGVF
jgi:hypothetical protein